MTPQEFASKYLMPVNITAKFDKSKMKKWQAPKNHKVAGSIDWSSTACTPVKDQGQCGSCWAFSATQTIESANIIAGKASPSGPILAPEQIVDCDTNDGGCGGGDPRSGMTYIQSANGQEFEYDYPYTAGQSGNAGSCNFNAQDIAEDDAGGPVDVSDGGEPALQSFLSSTGPPSVCVDASSWQSYSGGVLSSCGCNIDHAVQAVGINADGQANSYKIRNSWNTDWGVNGFIYLEMGQNTCCVANEVSWAQV
jgi:C1A family cysteine protease